MNYAENLHSKPLILHSERRDVKFILIGYAKVCYLSLDVVFMLLGFSMMPGYMTFVMIVSAIGGVLDASLINKKKKKRRINMKLDADAWNF